MSTNATLVYTGENKSFCFTNGSYVQNGQKVITNGSFERVDGANISKNDAYIASYNYSVENGNMKNLWVNVNDPSEAANVLAEISACFAELNTENE